MDAYAAAADALALQDGAAPPRREAALVKPTYVHQVPGRFRMELPHFKNNPSAIECARERLGSVAGIRSVRGNPVLGSLTVEYDPGMKSETLLSVLRAEGVDLRDSPKTGAAGCTCGYLSRNTPSPWKNVAFAGMAAHLVFDLIVWSTAAGALVSR